MSAVAERLVLGQATTTERRALGRDALGAVDVEVDDERAALLRELNQTLVRTSICGLGQVALGPMVSILDNFPGVTRREG